jgi:predicted RNA-binding Zn ribbon-like protein
MSSSLFLRDAGKPAPDELALVQRFLNTRSTRSGFTDHFDDTATAQDAVSECLRAWADENGSTAPHIEVTTTTVTALKALRDRVLRHIVGERVEVEARVTIGATEDGSLSIRPTGDELEWLESALWSAILSAQENDTLKRLKLCPNEGCLSAFYDRSKNNSGVWHDVRTCGNMVNLRASRARRKAGPQSQSSS